MESSGKILSLSRIEGRLHLNCVMLWVCTFVSHIQLFVSGTWQDWGSSSFELRHVMRQNHVSRMDCGMSHIWVRHGSQVTARLDFTCSLLRHNAAPLWCITKRMHSRVAATRECILKALHHFATDCATSHTRTSHVTHTQTWALAKLCLTLDLSHVSHTNNSCLVYNYE